MILANAEIPTWTYVIEGAWTLALGIGTIIASRSVYSRQNAKESAALINTLTKRVNVLEEDNSNLKKDVHSMAGELTSYRKMKTMDPDIIITLTKSMDAISTTSKAILKALESNGFKVNREIKK